MSSGDGKGSRPNRRRPTRLHPVTGLPYGPRSTRLPTVLSSDSSDLESISGRTAKARHASPPPADIIDFTVEDDEDDGEWEVSAKEQALLGVVKKEKEGPPVVHSLLDDNDEDEDDDDIIFLSMTGGQLPPQPRVKVENTSPPEAPPDTFNMLGLHEEIDDLAIEEEEDSRLANGIHEHGSPQEGPHPVLASQSGEPGQRQPPPTLPHSLSLLRRTAPPLFNPSPPRSSRSPEPILNFRMPSPTPPRESRHLKAIITPAGSQFGGSASDINTDVEEGTYTSAAFRRSALKRQKRHDDEDEDEDEGVNWTPEPRVKPNRAPSRNKRFKHTPRFHDPPTPPSSSSDSESDPEGPGGPPSSSDESSSGERNTFKSSELGLPEIKLDKPRTTTRRKREPQVGNGGRGRGSICLSRDVRAKLLRSTRPLDHISLLYPTLNDIESVAEAVGANPDDPAEVRLVKRTAAHFQLHLAGRFLKNMPVNLRNGLSAEIQANIFGNLLPGRLDHQEVFRTLFANLDGWAAVTQWVGAPAQDSNNIRDTFKYYRNNVARNIRAGLLIDEPERRAL